MALVAVICLCVWPVIINGFGSCYMLNVCVCVVPLSQPSSRDLVYPLRGCSCI